MVRNLEADLWLRAPSLLGEGPCWDARSNQFSWVDVLRSMVLVCDSGGRLISELRVPSHVGAALPAAAGGWVVALTDRLAHLQPDGTLRDVVPLEAHLPGNRANDAKCDPSGRAWVGTMSYDESKVEGSLYRLDPGPKLTLVLDGIGVSNGLGWSPDNRTMYFIDTVTEEVRAYPFDLYSGSIGEPRTLVVVNRADGVPDGMCTDDEGYLWVALWGGGRVHRYAPDGRLDTVVKVPVTYTTSCCFGGRDLDHLIITSARRDLEGDPMSEHRLDGSVFALRPGVTGPPATHWLEIAEHY
ncbi:MAG TPA: SMP-30/gluconolactonase/LRE family protein [Acidimicrobiales bacterium]|nr:SMP-30/gluconolactonase/LRE family protein [Acidimicrobiales bacterium]